MTVFILRGSHANEYELQNYYPIANKHDIHLVTTHHPLTNTLLPTHQLSAPTDLPNFPYRRQVFNRLIGGEQWLLGLEKLINNKCPNVLENRNIVIHTAETYTPYTHQSVELKKRGVINKLICTCWETIPHNNEKLARLRKWKQESYQYVDVFHTPTQRAKNALIADGVNPDKIIVIPYGVNLSSFTRLQGLTSKAKHKPTILTLARQVPEKGYQLWQQISRDLSHLAEFRWISDAPYTQIPAILASVDIFFFPSQITSTWEEQYGMALVEAMATALPIVATTSGAIPEVVKNVALLAAPSDRSSLISHLTKLINTPSLRVKYSKLAFARAKAHFDTQKISQQISTLYTV